MLQASRECCVLEKRTAREALCNLRKARKKKRDVEPLKHFFSLDNIFQCYTAAAAATRLHLHTTFPREFMAQLQNRNAAAAIATATPSDDRVIYLLRGSRFPSSCLSIPCLHLFVRYFFFFLTSSYYFFLYHVPGFIFLLYSVRRFANQANAVVSTCTTLDGREPFQWSPPASSRKNMHV